MAMSGTAIYFGQPRRLFEIRRRTGWLNEKYGARLPVGSIFNSGMSTKLFSTSFPFADEPFLRSEGRDNYGGVPAIPRSARSRQRYEDGWVYSDNRFRGEFRVVGDSNYP